MGLRWCLNRIKHDFNITEFIFLFYLTGSIMSSLANKIRPGQNIDNMWKRWAAGNELELSVFELSICLVDTGLMGTG